jgi:hypothetical protein
MEPSAPRRHCRQDFASVGQHVAGEFRSQPRLADAGLAGYHYQLAPSRRGPCPCLLQPVQLGAPADQRRLRRGGEDWRQARRVLARVGRGGGQVEGGVLAQDLLLKAAQSRSRVDAELRGEIVADPPVSAQSVRLTAGAVQGQHQMTPELPRNGSRPTRSSRSPTSCMGAERRSASARHSSAAGSPSLAASAGERRRASSP